MSRAGGGVLARHSRIVFSWRPMAIPLEDNFNDIVGKALRGSKLSKEQAASKAGVDAAALERLLDGDFDEAAARKVAPVLGLSANAVSDSGRKAWRPDPISIEG